MTTYNFSASGYENKLQQLSKKPFVPLQQHLPFQTKVQQHYPSPNDVPAAGVTSNELSAMKEARDVDNFRQQNEHGRPPVVTSPCYNADASGPPASDSTREFANKRHFGHRNLLHPAFQPHFVASDPNVSLKSPSAHSADPALRRRLLRGTTSGPSEANSLQARVLLESQFPSSNTPNVASYALMDLVTEPKNITNCVKRPFSSFRDNTLPLLLTDFYTQQRFVHEPLLSPQRPAKTLASYLYKKKTDANVFSYPLPQRRTKTYKGCIDSRASPLSLRRRDHSIEVCRVSLLRLDALRSPIFSLPKADGLFVLPKITAKVHDVQRPIKQLHLQRFKVSHDALFLKHINLKKTLFHFLSQPTLGPDLLPCSNARDDFLNSRPTKSVYSLQRKCRDNLSCGLFNNGDTIHALSNEHLMRKGCQNIRRQKTTQVAEILHHS